MFYFGRQFMAGRDPVKRSAFEAEWYKPGAPRVHRLITCVWGTAYVGEFIIRVIMVYTLPAAVVLLVSPFLLGGITVAVILWTFAYVRHMRQRAALHGQQAVSSMGQA